MELYELKIHFSSMCSTSNDEDLTLSNVQYYESQEKAIHRAKLIASSFITPKPDYWYLEDGAGVTIWTDNEEEVKRAIQYDILTNKPEIKLITLKEK